MLVQVGLLRETLSASLDWTQVWPIVGVDHEMVKEIVPLLEYLAAVVEGALQEEDDSPDLGWLVLKHKEGVHIWHHLVDTNL